MKYKTDFLDFLSCADADFDEADHAQSGGQKAVRRPAATHRPKSGGAHAKGQKGRKLGCYADHAYPFEVIPLKEDYSVRASQAPENYFTDPHFERERAKQRAIRPAMTAACLHFGEHQRGAASIHCTITDQSIADAKLVEVNIADLRGLRLVLTGNCRNVIKTGYGLDVPNGRLAA